MICCSETVIADTFGIPKRVSPEGAHVDGVDSEDIRRCGILEGEFGDD